MQMCEPGQLGISALHFVSERQPDLAEIDLMLELVRQEVVDVRFNDVFKDILLFVRLVQHIFGDIECELGWKIFLFMLLVLSLIALR